MKIIRDDSSYSNELEKMAKFNKKHQKGWGWFVNPKASINTKLDAGNVPLNNAIFNSNMGQGTSDGACCDAAIAEDLLEGNGDNLTPTKPSEKYNSIMRGLRDVAEMEYQSKAVKEIDKLLLNTSPSIDTFKSKNNRYKEINMKNKQKSNMGNSILDEELKIATPYMLRNDGELIECSPMHPYIKFIFESDQEALNKLATDRFFALQWFYKNTKEKTIKDNIRIIIKYLIDNNLVDSSNTSVFDINEKTYEASKEEIKDFLNILNADTNQEFLRIRTSSLLFGGNDNSIYFRISSIRFNWFDLIWQLVYKYRKNISDVTICKDSNTFGSHFQPYLIDNQKINKLPVDDFINLPGNPIIESNKNNSLDIIVESNKQLSTGKIISESYSNLHPRYSYGFYKKQVDDYLEEDISNLLYRKEYLDEKLIQSDSEEAFKKNVQTELDAGKPMKQALAIAYSVKEKNRMKKEDLNNLDFYEVKFKLRDKDTEEEFEEKETLSEEDFNSIPDMEEYLKSIYDGDKVEVIEVLGIEPINKNININEGKEMKKDLFKHLDIEEVIEWISEHNYLYRDFKNKFNYSFDEDSGEEKNIPSLEDTIGWLQGEGDTAWEDFKLYFDVDESLNEEYVPDITRVIDKYNLDVVTKEDMGNDYYYWKLLADTHDAEKFNYHSDYWGDADEYQEQAINVMSELESYIGNKAKIHLDDEGDLTCKVIGVLVDKQYNNHLKLLVEFDEEKKEESLNEEAKKSSSLISEIKKAIRDYYSDFNDEDYKDFIEDYTVVEVVPAFDKDMYKVEVRMEIGYDSFMELIEDKLDPIIRKYDKEAYFDMEDAGITNAFIPKNSLLNEEVKDDSEEKPLEEDKEITSTTIEAKWSPEANAYIIPKEEWEDWD